MDITWRVISGEGKRRTREKVQGIRSIICRYKIDEEVRSSIGKGKAKELICTTHGHELSDRTGNAGKKEGTG